MKKRCIYLFVLIISAFIFVGNTNAEGDTSCNSISLNELRTAAANLKVTYEPVVVEEKVQTNYGDYRTNQNKYLDIKIYNMMSKLYIKMDVNGKNMNSISEVFSLNNVGSDGAITIRHVPTDEIANYKFTVYSDSYGCTGKTLRIVNLTLPRRNPYSYRQKCEDIPEFYLCQDYVTFAIDASMFNKGVEEYKAKLAEQEKNGEIKTDNTGVVSKTISTLSKYKFVFVGIIIAIGIVVTVIILKRKKSVL